MSTKIKLNIGCGTKKMGDDYTNIDIDPKCKPDLLCDVTEGLPYDDNSVDVVRAFDFLEHIPIGKTIFVVDEIWRVLKPGGEFEHFTPSTDGRGAFQDPTHVSFWNINSWFYFTEGPHSGMYDIQSKFKVIELGNHITHDRFRIIHTFGKFKK